MKLEGLRVVDLSLFLPGPHLTMMMADHGAEVIKIEPPGEGEPNRHLGPREGSQSVYFRNTHRGKKSVVLNLKVPAGARGAADALRSRGRFRGSVPSGGGGTPGDRCSHAACAQPADRLLLDRRVRSAWPRP